MLHVVSLVSALAAALVVLGWAARRVDALGRRRPFPALSVVALAATGLATGVPVWLHAQFEHRLSDVASALVNSEVSVTCQTLSQAWTQARPEAGYVRFGADGRPEAVATITMQTCDDLQDWVASDHQNPSLDHVIAVHVLTHEAMHMAGHRDEARTECAAVQRDTWTARLLGADAEQARRLAVAYWLQVYPRLPDSYRSAGCAAGTSLDEQLDSPPWPAEAT